MPFWRSLDKTSVRWTRSSPGLQDTGSKIDAQMEQVRADQQEDRQGEQALTVSAFTQFAISTLVLLIAAGGALINFKLIALPFSEMVGAGDYLTGACALRRWRRWSSSLVEATMGLFVMECLRITHLFPIIANMNERMRRRMLWTAIVFLFILAGIEAALALMRDMLMAIAKRCCNRSPTPHRPWPRPTRCSRASRPRARCCSASSCPSRWRSSRSRSSRSSTRCAPLAGRCS